MTPSTAAHSENPKRDRRVERTKRLLQQALLELVRERDYDRITVQDILDRADVGRSTFYAHFRNKDHLLLGDFAVADFGPSADLGDREGSLFPGPIDLFDHLAENYDLYRALSGSEGLVALFDRLRASFLNRWRARVEATAGTVATEAAAQFLSSATMGTIIWWLEAGMPHPPALMNRTVDRLAAACLATLERGPDSENE